RVGTVAPETPSASAPRPTSATATAVATPTNHVTGGRGRRRGPQPAVASTRGAPARRLRVGGRSRLGTERRPADETGTVRRGGTSCPVDSRSARTVMTPPDPR